MNTDKVLRQKAHSAALLARRVAHVWRTEGLRPASQTLSGALKGFLPWRRRSEVRPSEFDLTNGVDTGGVVRIASMEIDSPNYLYARYYKASNREHFLEMLAGLNLDHREFTFVDYGSGKGLTLLLASHYPFRRIVGVEFGADLHRIAERNITNYKAPERRCFTVESVCADATDYAPPAGPLVCYFYDPFEPVILQRVLDNLHDSWLRSPRPIVLIYHGPPKSSVLHAEAHSREQVLLSVGFLQKVHSEDSMDVYQSPEVTQERATYARR